MDAETLDNRMRILLRHHISQSANSNIKYPSSSPLYIPIFKGIKE